jgi:DNA polymerase-4
MRPVESQFWQRAIVFIDMDAFFASIEQLDDPALRQQPVAVTNGLRGTCIITCSYEARARGIHTGMRIKEAQQRCPALVQRPARPQRYAQLATRMTDVLRETISPDLEIFSVDEAFLDVTHCQKLLGVPESIAQQTKDLIQQVVGLPCTVGVGGDKTTAKYIAKCHKPDGLGVLPPWEAREYLKDVPVTKLCGIAEGIGRFLAARGVYTCGDMSRLPIGVLAKRFGYPGRRIWLMCQGLDPEAIHTSVAAPKTLGHGKVMPPNTKNLDTLLMYLLHMSEKLATRLRRYSLQARSFSIGLLTQYGWLGDTYRTTVPTNDGKTITALTRQMLDEYWRGEGVSQVHITALDPRPVDGQLELFGEDQSERQAVNKMVDSINQRYGELTLGPARLLKRSDMPNVISPAWKPRGPRQSI